MAAPISIYESAHKGDFDRVKAVVDEDESIISKKDDNERILLHWAAISGNVKLVTYLIDLGSEIDALEETEATPLILAASAGRLEGLEVVKLLIQHKADINRKTTQGHSALQYAASKGWTEICVFLVENGANINITDIRGATPLHRAVSKGNIAIVMFLLSRTDEIDLNVKDIYGNTPLHLACEDNRREESSMLVINGARTDILNKESQLALDLCSSFLATLLRLLSEKD